MIDGAVAGVMSALMIGMTGNERGVNDKLRAIKAWMTKHRVPRMKQSRALNYFASHYKSQIKDDDILMDMPPAMRDDIAKHLYATVVASVPIFRDLSQEIVCALCEACQPMIAVKGQVIFEARKTSFS